MKHYNESKKYYRLLSDDYSLLPNQIYSGMSIAGNIGSISVADAVISYPEDWEEVKFVDGEWVEAKPKTYTLEEVREAIVKVLDFDIPSKDFERLKGHLFSSTNK